MYGPVMYIRGPTRSPVAIELFRLSSLDGENAPGVLIVVTPLAR